MIACEAGRFLCSYLEDEFGPEHTGTERKHKADTDDDQGAFVEIAGAAPFLVAEQHSGLRAGCSARAGEVPGKLLDAGIFGGKGAGYGDNEAKGQVNVPVDALGGHQSETARGGC